MQKERSVERFPDGRRTKLESLYLSDWPARALKRPTKIMVLPDSKDEKLPEPQFRDIDIDQIGEDLNDGSQKVLCRCIHIPVNNMSWVEEVLRKVLISKGFTKKQAKLWWKEPREGENWSCWKGPSHSNLDPTWSRSNKPSTYESTSAVPKPAKDKDKDKPGRNIEDLNTDEKRPKILATFFPYLHWEVSTATLDLVFGGDNMSFMLPHLPFVRRSSSPLHKSIAS